jgi:hypothetical protein
MISLIGAIKGLIEKKNRSLKDQLRTLLKISKTKDCVEKVLKSEDPIKTFRCEIEMIPKN